MPAIRRGLRSGRKVLVAIAVAVGLCAVVAAPAVAEDAEVRVKYYVVTASYLGAPENLYEIAERLLGSSSRFTEVFDLNIGRRQPDGRALSDPAQLTTGWSLVLPWDAVGREVQIGVLPTTMPTRPVTKPRATNPPSDPKPTQSPPASPTPTPALTATPASTQPGTPAPGSTKGCAVKESADEGSDWAARRLVPGQVWSQTQGHGEVVAIVDSGVDASLPELSGRVADGADIVTGSGGGTTDCMGSGTAMASLVAAKSGQDSAFVGVAPEATVMPVRVATSAAKPRSSDQATAIDVAVSTGATVIALGDYIDSTDPDVARAIANAVKHDVVVVVGAPVRGEAQGNAGPASPAVLRVGGIGGGGETAAKYQPGGVDVVAPGIDVSYLGVAGTGTRQGSGTRYAVALVAGQVALVRSAHPELDAVAVVRRIQATADRLAVAVPDPTFGYGMINLVSSVTASLSDEAATAGPSVLAEESESGGGRTLLIIVIALVVLGAVTMLVLRGRRILQAQADQEPGEDDDEDRPARDSLTSARSDPHRDRA